jgi:hypothetical protein
MKYPATITLIVVTVLVALSTGALYAVTGYGTMLFQLVMLGAWGAVAKIASPAYADNHALPLVAATLVLNLVYFLVPAVAAWLALRKRWPRVSSTVSALWCIFYVACLFILFPATDGP